MKRRSFLSSCTIVGTSVLAGCVSSISSGESYIVTNKGWDKTVEHVTVTRGGDEYVFDADEETGTIYFLTHVPESEVTIEEINHTDDIVEVNVQTSNPREYAETSEKVVELDDFEDISTVEFSVQIDGSENISASVSPCRCGMDGPV